MTTTSDRHLRFLNHVHELCRAFNIKLTIDPTLPLNESAAAVGRVGQPDIKMVKIRPIETDIAYSTALHEIGHCLHPVGTAHQFARDPVAYERLRMDAEEAAWEWARHMSLDWTDEMERDSQVALNTYRRAERLTPGAYGRMPGSRVATCPMCQARNRLKPTAKPQRCGKCAYVFTTLDVQHAVLGDKLGLPKVPAPLVTEIISDESEEDEDEEDEDEDNNRNLITWRPLRRL